VAVVTGQRSDANDELCRAGGVDLPPLGSSARSLSLSCSSHHRNY
jgi:hypothetical protein